MIYYFSSACKTVIKRKLNNIGMIKWKLLIRRKSSSSSLHLSVGKKHSGLGVGKVALQSHLNSIWIFFSINNSGYFLKPMILTKIKDTMMGSRWVI